MSAVPTSRWLGICAAVFIVLAAVAAYCNSFTGAFLYDDVDAIVENPSIRQLWPIWLPLSPPRGGETVSGRPLLNLSLAINFALGGLDVRGYHAVNLAIHIAAALLLLGIVRRTLLTPPLRDRFGRAATALALASALLWMVHPLQTESVTYVVQRAESLAGLFYLLTLYCVIRGAGTVADEGRETRDEGRGIGDQGPGVRNKRRGDTFCSPLASRPSPLAPLWYAAAVLACLLGMACKEVMVTAPLMVLLYDRTFLAGSFAEAWRRRRGLYVALTATWAVLAYSVLSTGLVARQVEMGAPSLWSYARTQPGVILHYLRLSIWPSPLCFDCDWPVASSFGAIFPGLIAVALLAAATVWGLLRRKAAAFLGAWFLLILAPTSSILPLGELAFEHRMYLPLAAITVLAVAGGYALWDRWLPRRLPVAMRWAAPTAILMIALFVLEYATVARNADYHSSLAFWRDTVEKRPGGFFAQYYLATTLASLGNTDEAIEHFNAALQLKPDYPRAHYNLANALAAAGKSNQAIEHYHEALRLKPDDAKACNNLAGCLAALGRSDEAIASYRNALRLRPDYAEAHNNLGTALAGSGKPGEAIQHFQQALRLMPDYPEAHSNLGNALMSLGKPDEAIEQYQQALRLKPDDVSAHNNLGLTLAAVGRTDEAIDHYQRALQVKPDNAAAHYNLGNVLAAVGRTSEALEHLQRALTLNPENAQAHNNFAIVLIALGRTDAAIDHFTEAFRLKPDFAMARCNLSNVLARLGRTREAIENYDRLLELTPNSKEALNNLAWLLATHESAASGEAARAVRLAERARDLGGDENARCLDTLAAAYAGAGRFSDATVTAERAVRVAESSGDAALAEMIRSRLELYRAGRPCRDGRR